VSSPPAIAVAQARAIRSVVGFGPAGVSHMGIEGP
jgi:hypothetical protein